MTKAATAIFLFGAVPLALGAPPLARITIDYPADGSIFPPEFPAPEFLWRDSAGSAAYWTVEVTFAAGSPALREKPPGDRLRLGPLDPRCVAATNEPPKLTAEQAAARTWRPAEGTWAAIKKTSVERPATVTITGYQDRARRHAVSQGSVAIQTSKDPVGAPVFYRDVPLMPSELEKGVIKPLAASAVPLIAWRLRYAGDTRSRLLLEGLHTCANCHSFSADGKTLGMDLDGPQNDKGMYAIAPVSPRMSIGNDQVISWSAFRDQPSGSMRVGFMSQVSPDGKFVVTTVSGVDSDIRRNYFVANFKDYRFLQVFYATRGILVYYDRATGRRQSLPGADDPRYVQTNAAWSPDGNYLVFARAEARDAYPEGRPLPEYANDPNETPVQYDLYRIPFNGGRGGRAEPVAGASANGMSNSFPRVSPDGRWIVFVQARNGLLMRPDSQLYVVPFEGGRARRMRCNTKLMNSWHSFSPNGRWMVFSSKSRSPYTQMYLTHLDEQGNDSPAVLIENTTAANRAVNLPEFVNVPPEGLQRIDVPAVEFYRLFDRAWESSQQGRYDEAIDRWQEALRQNPGDARALNNLGFALAQKGRFDEAIAQWQKSLESGGGYADVHLNLGRAFLRSGKLDDALPHLQKAVEIQPLDPAARANLGVALLQKGRLDESVVHLRRAVEIDLGNGEAHYNLGVALLRLERFDDAITQFQAALAINPQDAEAHNDLGVAFLRKGRLLESIAHFQQALAANPASAQTLFNLGNAFYLRGQIPEALAQWRRGLRLQPENASVLNQVAWVLATSRDAAVRDGPAAVEFASRAVQLSGSGQPAFLDTLAAAYAEAGRFADAVATARRALALAAKRNDRLFEETLKARLALYEARTPFREPVRAGVN